MSNLTQEIIALEQNRQAIVDAVNAKGGELAENAPLNAIAPAIEALPSGGENRLHQLLTGTLTSVTYEDTDGCTIIKKYKFSGETSILSVTIADTVETIEVYGFSNMSSMLRFDVGSGLQSMGQYALNYPDSCDIFIFRSVYPPTITTSSFRNSQLISSAKIYVPDESVEAYKTATNWTDKASRIHPLSELPQ